jgi:hypothetical protein
MGQRSICLFLAMKRLSAQASYNELVAVLGPDAIGDFTVTNYLRQQSKTGKSWLPLHGIHWISLDRGTS